MRQVREILRLSLEEMVRPGHAVIPPPAAAIAVAGGRRFWGKGADAIYTCPQLLFNRAEPQMPVRRRANDG